MEEIRGEELAVAIDEREDRINVRVTGTVGKTEEENRWAKHVKQEKRRI